MKNIFIKTASIFLLVSSIFSCTSYVEDMNVDPDLLNDADAANMFQGVVLANQFFQTSSSVRSAMLWLNQANGEDRQYVTLNNWNNATASGFDNNWDFAYVNTITQAQILEAKATGAANFRLKGAAQVIEAYCIGTVASLWGDVPYSDLDYKGFTRAPKYDAQADVYKSAQLLLDDAIANLSKTTGEVIPEKADIWYAGKTDKWIKLAYSIKAKLYLQTKNYTLAKANALLGINNAGDDFKAKFANSYLQSFNPFYSFLVYDRPDYMSGNGYAAQILDPSTTLYRGNAKTDEHARYAFTYNTELFDPYGLNVYGTDYGGTSGKFGSDTAIPLVTYGEMLLIIAEVDARSGFSSGLTSYNAYRALLNTGYSIGINNDGYDVDGDPDTDNAETFLYAPYTADDFAIGGIENNGTNRLTDQNALIREIYQERYIYFLGTFESFTDLGRSNNAAEIQLKAGFAGVPQRFLYPQKEINSNPNTPSPIPTIVTKTPVNN